jgi:hypothetical protein
MHSLEPFAGEQAHSAATHARPEPGWSSSEMKPIEIAGAEVIKVHRASQTIDFREDS